MIKAVLMLSLVMQSSGDDGFLKLREDWARNLHEKRLEASLAEYAEDAEFLSPEGSRIKGKAALKDLFETVTKAFDSDLKFTSMRVEISGDLAYDSGTYQETMVMRGTGKRHESSGSYLTVYRHQKSGEWLIVEQVWTGTVGGGPN